MGRVGALCLCMATFLEIWDFLKIKPLFEKMKKQKHPWFLGSGEVLIVGPPASSDGGSWLESRLLGPLLRASLSSPTLAPGASFPFPSMWRGAGPRAWTGERWGRRAPGRGELGWDSTQTCFGLHPDYAD